MAPPNWFDNNFDADYVMSGATVEEKVERALEQVAKNDRLRNELAIAFLQMEQAAGKGGVGGASPSQCVRGVVAQVLNAQS